MIDLKTLKLGDTVWIVLLDGGSLSVESCTAKLVDIGVLISVDRLNFELPMPAYDLFYSEKECVEYAISAAYCLAVALDWKVVKNRDSRRALESRLKELQDAQGN